MNDNYGNDPKWARHAKSIVRAEMVRRDLTYQDLEDLLADIGVEKSAGNLATRIGSGAFGVQLFLQVMVAMGVRGLDLRYIVEEVIPETQGWP